MNTKDVLTYGHKTVVQTLEMLPISVWTISGVCGTWSVKDILAHLASFEWVLVDTLQSCLEQGSTPHLDTYIKSGETFNDTEVELRKNQTPEETLEEYVRANAQVMVLVDRIPTAMLSQPGTIPWYGNEYSLDDYIVYAYYGHKREHMAQVGLFRT